MIKTCFLALLVFLVSQPVSYARAPLPTDNSGLMQLAFFDRDEQDFFDLNKKKKSGKNKKTAVSEGSHFKIVFEDNFRNNKNKWKEENSEHAKLKVSKGKYIFEYKKKAAAGRWNSYKSIPVNQERDFKIESVIKFKGGVKDHGYGIIWGAKNGNNRFDFAISGDGRYLYGKHVDGKFQAIINWKNSSHIKKGKTNKLTIRKSGPWIKFFINDAYVDKAMFTPFFGDNIGFKIRRKMKIEINSLIVSEDRRVERIMARAKAGSPSARAELGEILMWGEYSENINWDEAFKWTKKAADAGDPVGLYNLSIFYSWGMFREKFGHGKFGYGKDKTDELLKQALPGLRSLAKKGGVRALTHLAAIYGKGGIVEKDGKKAVKLYRMAAGDDFAPAYFFLGNAYRTGKGVKKDLKKSMQWQLKAAETGYARAYYLVGLHHSKNNDDSKYFKWVYMCSEKGLSLCQYFTGLYLERGLGGADKDLKEAVRFYRKAAAQGHSDAQFRLAGKLEKGEGVKKAPEEAIKWLRRSARLGSDRAILTLGLRYRSGRDNMPGNEGKSIRLSSMVVNMDKDNRVVEIARKALNENDRETGLLLLEQLKQNKETSFQENLRTEENLMRAIEAYKVGMSDIGTTLFREAIETDPETIYLDNYWYLLHENTIPLSFISDTLLKLLPEKKKDAGFWAIYATNANLAGQPGLALSAIRKLEETRATSDEKTAKKIKYVTAALKANAYIQIGKEKEAYNELFALGRIGKEDTAIVNYIIHWAKPLLKDKKKLAFVTGIDESRFTGKYVIPNPQPFHNMETGKLISPAVAPKLESKPKTGQETEPSPEPARKDKEPVVTILD